MYYFMSRSFTILRLLLWQAYFSYTLFFKDAAPTEIYTLSLHDALPICIAWPLAIVLAFSAGAAWHVATAQDADRKSTRLNSSHITISYAVFCLKKKKHQSHKAIVLRLMLLNNNSSALLHSLLCYTGF